MLTDSNFIHDGLLRLHRLGRSSTNHISCTKNLLPSILAPCFVNVCGGTIVLPRYGHMVWTWFLWWATLIQWMSTYNLCSGQIQFIPREKYYFLHVYVTKVLLRHNWLHVQIWLLYTKIKPQEEIITSGLAQRPSLWWDLFCQVLLPSRVANMHSETVIWAQH